MRTVCELPDNVRLSDHLRETATFYICILSFGQPYYIPATLKIRQLLGLDISGKPAAPDKRRRFDDYDKEDAIRDIIAALHLQVRDVVLGHIEENVKSAILQRMNELMTPTVRKMIEDRTPESHLPLDAGCANCASIAGSATITGTARFSGNA